MSYLKNGWSYCLDFFIGVTSRSSACARAVLIKSHQTNRPNQPTLKITKTMCKIRIFCPITLRFGMEVDLSILECPVDLDSCQSNHFRHQPNQPLRGFIVKFSKWVKTNISDPNSIRLGHGNSMTSFYTLKMTNQPIWSPIDIIDWYGASFLPSTFIS